MTEWTNLQATLYFNSFIYADIHMYINKHSRYYMHISFFFSLFKILLFYECTMAIQKRKKKKIYIYIFDCFYFICQQGQRKKCWCHKIIRYTNICDKCWCINQKANYSVGDILIILLSFRLHNFATVSANKS